MVNPALKWRIHFQVFKSHRFEPGSMTYTGGTPFSTMPLFSTLFSAIYVFCEFSCWKKGDHRCTRKLVPCVLCKAKHIKTTFISTDRGFKIDAKSVTLSFNQIRTFRVWCQLKASIWNPVWVKSDFVTYALWSTETSFFNRVFLKISAYWISSLFTILE